MKKLFFVFFFLFSLIVSAQLTIRGKVVDENNTPLPFVNVYALKTSKGQVTDTNGEFSFTVNAARTTIEVAFLGYVSQQLKVTKRTKYLTIILKEEESQLEEVVIITKPKKRLSKKENPAYKILKEIWKRKKNNGLQLVNAYEYKKQLTTEIGLTNLDTVFIKKIFKDEYQTILNKLPYNETGINFYIPLFLAETVSKVYGNNTINQERIDIEAEKTEGIQRQGFIFERISNTFSFVELYKDNFQLLQKSFVSPISATGFDTYDYVLHDSINDNGKKKYQIFFFPRRNDLAFEGNFWVADKTFAISSIKMSTNKDININFVRRISIEKEFTVSNDSIYLPKKDIYISDFSLDEGDFTKGVSVKKTISYGDYIFDQPLAKSFYSDQIIRYKPKQFEKKEVYWDSINKEHPKSDTYLLVKDIKNDKQIQKFTGFFTALSSGYFAVTPKFQLGKYWNTVTSNNVEGVKLKLGFRTFETQDDRFRLNGFVGYGIRDERYKYQLEVKYLLSYKPRIGIGASYINDAEQLGARLLNTNGLNARQFDPNALLARGDNFFLSLINKSVFQLDLEVKKNFHIGTSFAHNQISSAAQREDFTIDYLDEKGEVQTQLTDVSQDFYTVFTPGRFEFGYGIEQRMGKNLYPTFILNYRKGYKGLLNGTFNYDKVSFNYNHPILLGKIGLFITTLDAGKTFGTVPLSLLNPIPANQTFWITRGAFSLINYYDYITDTYITGHFEHHFNGFLLNRIPLLKKLKLRAVATFSTVYGTLSENNRAINRSNITYKAPDDKLYYEYGFGVENIGYADIRPLRVDFIWRGEHQSINGLPSPKFAVRIGLKPGF